jgi:cell division septum initiation protein DivIVA
MTDRTTDEPDLAPVPAAADGVDGRRDGLTGVLDALEEVVSQARTMPMSSSVLVSRAEVLDLLGQARRVLPDQLARADEILAGADRVRADAQEQAEQVLQAARERAEELVDSDHVVEAARRRAEEIVEEARRTAADLRHDADDYCDRRLADFEVDLGKVLAQVQAGRAKLAGRLDGEAG